VLVTGGAGFLARGIYRRARREGWNASFCAFSRDDAKHAALQARYPEVDCVLGDVAGTEVEDLTWLMRGYDLVIHAAASKYVDRAEAAAFDTTRTNVIGSMRVAEAAIYARVPRVIAISTDKACAPVNVYGMTKAVMERVMQEADRRSPATAFNVVRYGNVIGSTGSVIPMFMRWAAEGQPIKLTDPLMTRFWMSVDDAVEVIVRATCATPGTVLVPPMQAMDMKNLVRMALGEHEYGPLPETGVEIVGIRAGEKRHETIIQRNESIRTVAADDGWREIMPATAPREQPEFEVTSARPSGGWMGVNEMREAVADAALV
jgi:UDP-N-acetylglucosamine 4,6-dehydratase